MAFRTGKLSVCCAYEADQARKALAEKEKERTRSRSMMHVHGGEALYHGSTPLMLAAMNGRKGEVREAFREGRGGLLGIRLGASGPSAIGNIFLCCVSMRWWDLSWLVGWSRSGVATVSPGLRRRCRNSWSKARRRTRSTPTATRP